MNQPWNDFIASVQPTDLLDIVVIAGFVGFLLQWWSRRRLPSFLLGGVLVAMLYGAATKLELYMLRNLMDVGLPVLLFGLLVLFQEELRFELERLRTWYVRKSTPDMDVKCTEMVCEAINLLADRRIGALLVFPRKQSIERFMRSGAELNALPSVPLIHSLFHPDSGGHDGAVIVKGGKLLKFGVHLPLSSTVDKIRQLGTRHAAALGLAERTDAVVLVVSEETGGVSIAREGELTSVPADQVYAALQPLVTGNTGAADEDAVSVWGKRLGTAALSLLISMTIWYTFAFRIQTVQRTLGGVTVELHGVPEQTSIHGPTPGTVALTLAGPQRVLENLQPDALTVIIDLQKQTPELPWIRISRRHIQLSEGVELLGVEPEFVRVELSEVSAEEQAEPPTAASRDVQ